MGKPRSSFDEIRKKLAEDKVSKANKKANKAATKDNADSPPPVSPRQRSDASAPKPEFRKESNSSENFSDNSEDSLSNTFPESNSTDNVVPRRGSNSPSVSPRGPGPWTKQQPKTEQAQSYLGEERLSEEQRRVAEEKRRIAEEQRILNAYNQLPEDNHFQKTFKEIITTEQTFKNAMQAFVSSVQNVISNNAIVKELKLSTSQVDTIRKYLEAYQKIDKEFNVIDSNSKLSDILNLPKADFTGFKEAIIQFDKATVFFNELFEKNPKFKVTMQNYLNLLSNNSKQEFSSYLIMPVQRMPRYVLLLNELVKQNEKTNIPEGLPMLNQLARGIKDKVDDLNSSKRIAETKEQMSAFYDVINVMAKAQGEEFYKQYQVIQGNNLSSEEKLKELIELIQNIKSSPGYQSFIKSMKDSPKLFPSAVSEMRDLEKLEKIMIALAWAKELEFVFTKLQSANRMASFPEGLIENVNILHDVTAKWTNSDAKTMMDKKGFAKFEKDYQVFIDKLKNVEPQIKALENAGRFTDTPSAKITAMMAKNPQIFEKSAPSVKTPR